MRKLTTALLIAGSALAAAPAWAQDATVNPVFTGPRIAAIGGYDAVRPGSSEDSDLDGDDQTVDGFLYGGEIGYDFAAGGALIGIEGEISDSTGKVDVNGPAASPLFDRLKSEAPGLMGSRAIKWNFTKFLVNREGRAVRRYAPQTKPEELRRDIEALL